MLATTERLQYARQSGVAIVTAMLVVALAALVVTGLYTRQNVAVRSIENRLNLSQSRWLERAVVDWAKVILRDDKRRFGTVDHKGEPWATRANSTQVDETITAGGKIDNSDVKPNLEGGMEDAQGLFNLSNLVNNGKIDALEVDTLRRILLFLNAPEGLAQATAQAVLEKQSRNPVGGGGQVTGQVADQLPFKRAADLIAIVGFTPAIIQALADHVVVLPRRTSINLNTATPEVLAASLSAQVQTTAPAVPNADLPFARGALERAIQSPFTSVEDFRQKMSLTTAPPSVRFDVKTNFVLLKGVIRYDRVTSRSAVLFDRSSNSVEVVWQDRY
jgi:general secretion pathway protein K